MQIEYMRIGNDRVRESLCTLEVEHRLEYVALKDGVFYVNDSAAVNENRTWYSLQTMTRPVVWIAGGIDKGNDYRIVADAVKEHVMATVWVGAVSDRARKLHADLRHGVELVDSMHEAVGTARMIAERGMVVMLSPAAASFDRYENYEHRGWDFKRCVANI